MSGASGLKKAKSILLAGKGMATLFWECQGTSCRLFGKGETIADAHDTSTELQETCPRSVQKNSFSIKTRPQVMSL